MKSKKNKFLVLGTIIAIVASIGVCVSGQRLEAAQETRTIVDMMGITVEIPDKIERIVTIYPIATDIVYTVYGQDKLVGIDSFSPKDKMFQRVDSNIKNIVPVGMPWEVNIESILALNPDVVLGGFGDVRKQIENVGIPVIGINVENPDLLKKGILLIGKIVGRENEANKLVSYYDEKMEIITKRTSGIPRNEKIKVLIPNKSSRLSYTGSGSYQHYLIVGAGGVNVAENINIPGRWPQVSIEQILAWNPEVVVVPPYCKDSAKDILTDPQWQGVNAVKNSRVYTMPKGVASWDCPGPDSFLGVIWLAKMLYPDKFKDIDLTKETKEFYFEFYGLNFTEEEVARILHPHK